VSSKTELSEKGFDRLQAIRQRVANDAQLPINDQRVVGVAGLIMQHELMTVRQINGEDVDTAALLALTKAISEQLPKPPEPPVEVKIKFVGGKKRIECKACGEKHCIEEMCTKCLFPVHGDLYYWRQRKAKGAQTPECSDDVSAPVADVAPREESAATPITKPEQLKKAIPAAAVVSNGECYMGGFSSGVDAFGLKRWPNPNR
jgi:hypothetical protein